MLMIMSCKFISEMAIQVLRNGVLYVINESEYDDRDCEIVQG